jgi:hypothetical protein
MIASFRLSPRDCRALQCGLAETILVDVGEDAFAGAFTAAAPADDTSLTTSIACGEASRAAAAPWKAAALEGGASARVVPASACRPATALFLRSEDPCVDFGAPLPLVAEQLKLLLEGVAVPADGTLSYDDGGTATTFRVVRAMPQGVAFVRILRSTLVVLNPDDSAALRVTAASPWKSPPPTAGRDTSLTPGRQLQRSPEAAEPDTSNDATPAVDDITSRLSGMNLTSETVATPPASAAAAEPAPVGATASGAAAPTPEHLLAGLE